MLQVGNTLGVTNLNPFAPCGGRPEGQESPHLPCLTLYKPNNHVQWCKSPSYWSFQHRYKKHLRTHTHTHSHYHSPSCTHRLAILFKRGRVPFPSLLSPCLQQEVAMETGLDWKQQERKKEIRCSAHLSTTPPLCPSLKIPLSNTMHFQVITGFP